MKIYNIFFIQIIIFILTKQSIIRSEPITFVPQWIPQSQFAGFYVAAEKGFYRENQLDVIILKGGPDNSPSEAIQSGKAQFTTLWLSEAIKHIDNGQKIVNIAQLFQHSSQMIIAKRSSGINTIEDLNHQSIQVYNSEFYYLPKAFFDKYNLTVNLIPQVRSMNLFLWNGVKAALVMNFNEYHRIINSGYDEDELVTFPFSEHGLNFPEDGIYCTESYYHNHKEICSLFVDASLRGWKYAVKNPEEALAIMMPFVDSAYTGSNYVHEKWMLSTVSSLLFTDDGKNIGILKEEDYNKLIVLLKELKLISYNVSYDSFYKGKEIIRVQE